jgi:hypothetical protein
MEAPRRPRPPTTPQNNVTDESITNENTVTNNITNESEAPPEIVYVPTSMREVCTTIRYGTDIEETDCRTVPLQAADVNPALEGICTILYGRRTVTRGGAQARTLFESES